MGKAYRNQFGQIERRQSTVPGRKPKYRPRYVGPDGHRYNGPSFDTVGEAEAFLTNAERDIRVGVWQPPTAVPQTRIGPPTFAVYAEECIVGRMNRPVKPLRASTASNYRKQLRLELVPAFGSKPINQITESDVRVWHKLSSAKGHPTQTANAYLFLSSVMNEAVKAGLIPSSPCKIPGAQGKPAPKHEAETLTIEELRDYLEAVPDQYRLPLMLAAFCALRSGEVRGLRVRDVDASTGRITVARAVSRVDGEYLIGHPKTKAGIRAIYAPSFLCPSLKEYLEKQPARSRDRLLFTARDGATPLHATVLREAHAKGREAIGRPTLTVHDLRKTAATLAAQQGATTKEIMTMLGHTTPTVAMIYQSAAEQRMKEIADRMAAEVGDRISGGRIPQSGPAG